MLVLDPPPIQLEELLEQRRRIGADRHDEVWAGVYHMVPAASAAHSFLTQQVSVLLDEPARAAGLRVSMEFNLGAKDNFRVPDLGIHREPSVSLLALRAGEYRPADHSQLLDLATSELAARIEWPDRD